MRRPFMHTPEQLASLDGQQYLVLRPRLAVADLYTAEQPAALEVAELPRPHTGHVTLRGFYEPTRQEDLASLVRAWAAAQQPIEIIAEAVDAFPAPWQILILRLARTPSLVAAYATLTELLAASDFRRLGELDLDDWTFHLSVVYGKTLTGEAWNDIESARTRDLVEPPHEIVLDAELVSYSHGEEHAEIIRLGT
ncbi:2'-5' RNA ligase family protein [Microbacterium sp. NPDC087665]|uniref:2'-5' RNA ligase family protein n=1 Tax=Microbacterium sp. NPDC087665 TaxID=3364194 RepID=UPI0037F57F71